MAGSAATAKRWALVGSVVLATLGVPAGGHCAGPAPALTADLLGSYNPLGIKLRGDYVERWGAEEAGSRYVEAGGGLAVSPAYAQGALHVEGAPVPFLVLRGQYDLYGFFGANGSLLSFASKDADFGPDELKDRKGEERSGFGHRVLFQPTLRMKLGSVVLRNQTDLCWYRFDGRGPYFYEQEYDTLLRDGDLLVANRTQALVDWSRETHTETFFAGPFYEIVRARDSGITRQRWGLLGYWEGSAGSPSRGKPHAFALTGVNTEDRNRQGELFVALGVGMTFTP